jgi:hypothetical protein
LQHKTHVPQHGVNKRTGLRRFGIIQEKQAITRLK